MNENDLREIDLTEIPKIIERLNTLKEICHILYQHELLTKQQKPQKPIVEKQPSKIKKIYNIIKE